MNEYWKWGGFKTECASIVGLNVVDVSFKQLSASVAREIAVVKMLGCSLKIIFDIVQMFKRLDVYCMPYRDYIPLIFLIPG